MKPRFASVVLDVDSTLCGVEGVDWLATLRGPEVARRSAELTDRAMTGGMKIEAAYGERLRMIRPTRAEMTRLADVYRQNVAPDAAAAISALRGAGVRLILVSGGFRPAIAPLASDLGFSDGDVFAVDVYWNATGDFSGYEESAPTTRQTGKLEIVRSLGLPRPVLGVGDGSTDLEMRGAVDQFAAFTGFVRREPIARAADREVASFEELARWVLES